MINPEFLKLLRCPETRQPLVPADPSVVKAVNEKIAKGTLSGRGGQKITQSCDGGLIRQDGAVFYPVRADIPVLLAAESIALS
jgi:uncharacterized protein YbaR (Trm112 family)